MATESFALQRIFNKLSTRFPLGEEDREAIAGLPCTVRTMDAGAYLLREGEQVDYCTFILSGFTFRQKTTVAGDRQILAVNIPGDILDLASLFLRTADHNIQTISRAQIAYVPQAALEALFEKRTNVARAMWVDAQIDGSVFREWILNIGRRNAIGGVAHLLCELSVRFEAAGLVEEAGDPFSNPMTQEQIADAVGITQIHANRTLQRLTKDGFIERDNRQIIITDWDRLAELADFSQRYLHFDQRVPVQSVDRKNVSNIIV